MNEFYKVVSDKVDDSMWMDMSLSEFRDILNKECGVYVCGESYLAKKFDQINYRFCGKDEAKEILEDNLYALLRYKYFSSSSDDIDSRIKEIVLSFTQNIKTTLIKVSFDYDTDAEKVNWLKDGWIAFRDGVYDIIKNEWVFKYDVIGIPLIKNKIYQYDPKYIITWYVNMKFSQWKGFDIKIDDTQEFINQIKTIKKETGCFRLVYNMSFGKNGTFDASKFEHLCEIMGYCLLQSFSQSFVMFIGTGQNGKNSLFDGCFSHKIIPTPAANDLDSIENDRFVTGSLENKSHNIYLESSAKTYFESKNLKSLTGSPYQTIESKGVNKYSGIINCKYIFAGNDQDKIKFKDTTHGFKRRINMYEVYYKWDKDGNYLKYPQMYKSDFSEDLSELKEDNSNIETFIYLGCRGIWKGTGGMSHSFKFSYNDWNDKYSDIDTALKEKIENLDTEYIVNYLKSSKERFENGRPIMYDIYGVRLYQSNSMREEGVNTYEKMIDFLASEENTLRFFSENDCYINLRLLQKMVMGDNFSSLSFTTAFKKLYGIEKDFKSFYGNQPYVKCNFSKSKFTYIGDDIK